MLSSKEISQYKKQFSDVDERVSRLFDALGDTNRFKIFMLLMEAKKDICVSEFADICEISVPAASQQLKSLELSGLIKRVRMGQTTCYKIKYEDPSVKSLSKTVFSIVLYISKKKTKFFNAS